MTALSLVTLAGITVSGKELALVVVAVVVVVGIIGFAASRRRKA